jgi:hypothetical protein
VLQGVRGRRRVLYSPPMKRATIPPAVPPKPQPAAATKPRANSSPLGSPKLIRATNRATVLRQANAAAKKESRSVSPRLASPRSLLNESLGSSSLGNSPRSVGGVSSVCSSGGSGRSAASRYSPRNGAADIINDENRTTPPGLVRQGTFTKDDPSAGGTSGKAAKHPASGIPRHSPGSNTVVVASSSTAAQNFRQASSVSLRGGTASGRTPPKVAPKPLFPRRSDTVQPCSPAPPKPLVATTKTQALREEQSALLSRGGNLRSSNSSTSSKASSGVSRQSIRTSSSSQSLRNAAGGDSPPKRVPSSSDIERRKTSTSTAPPRTLSPDGGGRTLSPQARRPWSPGSDSAAKKSSGTAAMPAAAAPKKDVTSKIASLWKKVEESKHKQQQHASKKDGTVMKDKRVWMSRGGKLQQEDDEGSRHNSGAPPGRLIRSGTYEKLNTDQLAPPASAPQPKEMKARSRSRLSIKLSKFGLTKRRDDDQANGNHHHQPAQSPDELDELGNNLPRDALDSGQAHPADAALSVMTAATAAGRSFRSSSSVSSSRGSLAAAVVAPFNYTPSSSNGGLERIKSAAQIKRNSSYVSSMGRRQEGVAGDVSPDEEEAERRGKKTPTGAAPSPMVYAGNTSSSVVTLV